MTAVEAGHATVHEPPLFTRTLRKALTDVANRYEHDPQLRVVRLIVENLFLSYSHKLDVQSSRVIEMVGEEIQVISQRLKKSKATRTEQVAAYSVAVQAAMATERLAMPLPSYVASRYNNSPFYIVGCIELLMNNGHIARFKEWIDELIADLGHKPMLEAHKAVLEKLNTEEALCLWQLLEAYFNEYVGSDGTFVYCESSATKLKDLLGCSDEVFASLSRYFKTNRLVTSANTEGLRDEEYIDLEDAKDKLVEAVNAVMDMAEPAEGMTEAKFHFLKGLIERGAY